MTQNDLSDLKDMMSEAEAKAKALEDIESRNRRRMAKGRPPLPDPQAKEDEKAGRRIYRTGDFTTVSGDEAVKLFELRKSEMMSQGDDEDPEEEPTPFPPAKKARSRKAKSDTSAEQAVRAAAAARRAEDLKAGRIDHEGNWSKEGQRLEGGDETSLITAQEAGKAWGLDSGDKPDPVQKPADEAHAAGADNPSLEEFKADLYKRLGTSFSAIERTLSDLQGRVAEIVTAPSAPYGLDGDEFKAMLERKTPVAFDVGGASMEFDAICVFHAPPCITLVSKIGSAKIMPKPGAQLFLTYEMDGQKYDRDPVTFLGTRFDLPMFGLSFVGFIRDQEASMIDAAAGLPAEE